MSNKRYHVNQSHPEASDDNVGRIGTPLRTVGRAVELAEDGDTVLIHNGVYRESIIVTKDILIKNAKDNNGVFMTCSDRVTQWIPYIKHIWRKRWFGEFYSLSANGECLDKVDSLHGVSEGSCYFDKDKKTVYVWNHGNIDPNTITMEISSRGYVLKIESDNVTVDGIEVDLPIFFPSKD